MLNSTPVSTFHSRTVQDEIMDGADFDFNEYSVTLDQLELINRLTRGYAPTLRAVARVFKAHRLTSPGKGLRILDIGCGGGDTLRAIAKWARGQGVEVDLLGVDLNPWARKVAERKTRPADGIRYLSQNIFDLQEEPFDFVINSLFMHHLSDEQVVDTLKWMSQRGKLGWFINDLHRHPLAYHFIRFATQLCGANRLICSDAPLSVARGFQIEDWRKYLRQAGLALDQVEIRWHWSFRYGVFWSSNAG